MNISEIIAVLAARTIGKKTPLHASLALTWRCNLKCAYCARWKNPGPELPVETWRRIIDDLVRAGCRRISLTGGEPLVYNGALELAGHARRKGVRVALNTNGVLVPRMIDAINISVDRIVLSLDGDKQAHENARGVGSWDRVMEAATVLKDHQKPFEFYTVIAAHNADGIDQVLDIADRFGVVVTFQPGSPTSLGGEGDNPKAAEPEAMRRAFKSLAKAKEQSRPIANSLTGLKAMSRWPDQEKVRCFGPGLFCRIEPDGAMRICGRDLLSKDQRPMTADRPADDAFAMLNEPGCATCMSAARLELNLALKPSWEAAWNLVKKRQ
jgi:MoaA/NifB/PqqE/SkfB family radical SAM enzyme